jgi:hypothetical protein
VLAVAASPTDLPPLDWQREVAVLREALQELAAGKQVEVHTCEHATRDKLQMALLDHSPDVVHFIGHGEYDHERQEGLLMLEDERGKKVPLSALEAARSLRHRDVSLVVLNACETAQGAWAGLASSLVRADIPAVVAMQWPVEDQAAIRFSRAFFRALAMGRTVDECVTEGRHGASTSAYPADWAAPVLFMRSPSGRLWNSAPIRFRGQRGGAVTTAARTVLRGGPPQEASYFRTRGPLLSESDAELIVERPELRRALRLAQQPSVTQYIAVLGARQTGKTTLLLRLRDLLGESCVCVVMDLSLLRAQEARACFRLVAFHLIGELRAVLGNENIPAQLPPVDGAVDFVEFLRVLAEGLPLPRVVLLLDEVGALSPEASDIFFNTLRTVFSQGRGQSNALTKYLFVFSGAVDLYQLTTGANSPLNICEKLYLQDFELADVQRIVAQFHRLGVTMAPHAAEAVYEQAGGHPYLTMRLCMLMERAGVKEVTADTVAEAGEQILLEDDHLRHCLQELERRPAERKRLRSILFEERQIPFSRNDPVLASLEMIGAVRPTQPTQVRNRLLERALRVYYEQREASPAELFLPLSAAAEEAVTVYTRLQELRAEALDAEGMYVRGKPWETFAAALFSLVPAFSVYPDSYADNDPASLVLGVSTSAPGGEYWKAYGTDILVECVDLRQALPEQVLERILRKARRQQARLVFLIMAGNMTAAQQQVCRTGTPGDQCIVPLQDSEIAALLEQHDDLDAFLRHKVLETRLRAS